MASENPSSSPKTPLYPKIDPNPTPSAPPLPPPSSSNPNDQPSSSSSSNPNQPSSSLYPTIEMKELPENPFPDSPHNKNSRESVEEVIISVPGAILHLIDKKDSVKLASGDFSLTRLRQGDDHIAILARVDDEIQWPLARDEACVKLDHAHYFFVMRAHKENEKDDHDHDHDHMLNYGLTFASKGQDKVLKELDELLEKYTSFSVQKVDEKKEGALDVTMANEMGPSDLKSEVKKEEMEHTCSAYWSTLAPNVEDYSGIAAKLIAAGSGQLVKGILWCGDVTVDRLKWGNEVLKKKLEPGTEKEVSPETLKRIKRVKKVSKLTDRVAGGILSGVLKVTGYFASSIVNSKAGKKFFRLMPGEIALATLDGFSKIFDAFEVSGRSIMSTSSTVTTELVCHKYGKETAEATNEGLDAAGHAIGAAWTVFKLRQAVVPKGAVNPSALSSKAIRNATEEMKKKAIKDMEAKDKAKSSSKKPK